MFSTSPLEAADISGWKAAIFWRLKYTIYIYHIYISYIYILLVIQDWLAKCPNTTSASLSLVFVSPFNVSPTQANHSCVGWARGGL
jgi:hypothetical protein